MDRADEVTPLEAFELGRRYEQELQEARTAREAFVTDWAKTGRRSSTAASRAREVVRRVSRGPDRHWLFVVFEGGDGVGKSTQVELLCSTG